MTSKNTFRKYPFASPRSLSLAALLLLLAVGASQAQWLKTNLPGSPKVQTLAVSGTVLLAGTDGSGIFKSIDSGTSWIHDTTLSKFNTGAVRVNVLATNGKYFFAGSNDGIYRSLSSGTSWIQKNSGLTTKVVSYPGALAAKGSDLFVVGARQGFHSTDTGNTWASVNSAASDGLPLDVQCFSILGTSVFAGMQNSNSGFNLFRSTDNGDTWIHTSKGLPSLASIWGFAAIDTNLFAATSKGVFRSSNNGTSWAGANKGFEDSTVIVPLIANGKNLFAGTQKGDVYLSSNNGDSWTLVNKTGLTVSSVSLISSIAVVGSNVFIGTINLSDRPPTGEVWKRPISEIFTPVQVMNEVPLKFDFERNLGGAIHSGDRIGISVKKRSMINLSIYDAKGSKVLTLVDSEFPPGIHYSILDGSRLSNGLYFLRLQNNEIIFTQKIIFSE